MAKYEAGLSSGATAISDREELDRKKHLDSKLWIKSDGKVDWDKVYMMASLLFGQAMWIYFFYNVYNAYERNGTLSWFMMAWTVMAVLYTALAIWAVTGHLIAWYFGLLW